MIARARFESLLHPNCARVFLRPNVPPENSDLLEKIGIMPFLRSLS